MGGCLLHLLLDKYGCKVKHDPSQSEVNMKKTLWLALSLAALLLLLTACESGGKFHVHNSTSFPAYVRVDGGSEITLPAGGDVEFEIDTDTQSMFTGEVSKLVKVWLKGETFHLYDTDEARFTDSTWVTVKAGETLHAYLNPNRACIKIINSSSQFVRTAEIWKRTATSQVRIATIDSLASGESTYLRVDPASATAQFYYQVALVMADDSNFLYGDTSNILYKDQQFVVTHEDPQ